MLQKCWVNGITYDFQTLAPLTIENRIEKLTINTLHANLDTFSHYTKTDSFQIRQSSTWIIFDNKPQVFNCIYI